MKFAELANAVDAELRKLRQPWSHLTPRKRKKRWNLHMKHIQRSIYGGLSFPTTPEAAPPRSPE